ncbi:MAG: phage holin family protein [Clostridiales bacterium]|nr:phage holin family protein [Clostridiales bacterium]MDR2711757.1 phage holin family protein [Clostridiales bacterium]
MKKFLTRWLINSVALILIERFVSGVHANSLWTIVVAALIFGILNALVRPILLLLTLPINMATLGLFTFVVNAAILGMTGAVVRGFYINNFLTAIWASILLSLASMILSSFVKDK